MTLVFLIVIIISIFVPDLQTMINGIETSEKYAKNDQIPLYVKGLTSNTESYTFIYRRYDFCQSEETESTYNGNFNDSQYGPRSPYAINFLEDSPCKILCQKTYTVEYNRRIQLDLVRMIIAYNYEHRWFVNKLPVKLCYSDGEDISECRDSFPVGCHTSKNLNTCAPILNNPKNDTFYIFNHVDLEFVYQAEEGTNEGQIILVKVKPASIDHGKDLGNVNCGNFNSPLEIKWALDEDEEFYITYTYSVRFFKNNTMKVVIGSGLLSN